MWAVSRGQEVQGQVCSLWDIRAEAVGSARHEQQNAKIAALQKPKNNGQEKSIIPLTQGILWEEAVGEEKKRNLERKAK